MRRLALALLLVLLATPAWAQRGSYVDGTAMGGTTLPGTCTVGDLYLKTDATAGQNWHFCTATNTWTQQLNTGGGGGGAPTDVPYWAGAADATLSAEHNLGALGTGAVLNTGGTPSIYAGTTCTNQVVTALNASLAATCASIVNAMITNATIDLTTKVTGILPVANGGTGNGTGNAPTATALAANPANCSAGLLPRGVDAGGVGEGCAAVNLTTETTGDLTAAQQVIFSGDISPAQLTANTNDWAPTGLSATSTIRFSTDASRDITGIAGGVDGRILMLINIGAQAAVLRNDATSTAANRFLFGTDHTVGANESIILRYDAVSSRWRRVAYGGTGGGGSGTIVAGATGALPKYTATTTLDDSLLSDDGTTLRYTGTGGLEVPKLTVTGAGGTEIEFSVIAAPATPAAGKGVVYVDSTSKTLCVKNDAGSVTCTGGGGSGTVTSVTTTKQDLSVATTTTTPVISLKGVFSLGACTGTIAIDWNNGSTQRCTSLTGNTTFTMANPQDGARYAIILPQDATGSRTVAVPAAWHWPSGVTPTTSGASQIDVFSAIYANSVYFGVASFNYAP